MIVDGVDFQFMNMSFFSEYILYLGIISGILVDPVGIAAEIGDQLVFSCTSSPSPPDITPSTYWQIDGNAVQSASYSYLEENNDGSVTSNLVLFSVTGAMDGNYVCFITFNEQVVESAPATLSVVGIMSFPTSARGVEGNGAVVTCVSSGDNYGTDIIWYKDGQDVTTVGLGSLSSPGNNFLNWLIIEL